MRTNTTTFRIPSHYTVILILPILLVLCAMQTAYCGSATWLSLPMDTDWNNPENWTGNGPPNGPSDTATFSSSDGTDVSISDFTYVDGIIFDAGASQFTITAFYPIGILTLSGAGVINDSAVTQNFIVHGQMFLTNDAAVEGPVSIVTGNDGSGYVQFSGNATAGNCIFDLDPGTVEFYGNATADNGVFHAHGFHFCGSGAGSVLFYDTASAGNGTFTVDGGAICGTGGGGGVDFGGTSTADNAVFTINGATNSDESGGYISFQGGSEDGPTAGNATLIANGGSGGGSGSSIQFISVSAGGTSRVELFGNSTLLVDLLYIPSLTIGSIEGAGTVSLNNHVNLAVGSNNLSTTFSGIIQEVVNGPCSVTKIGTGTLTLSGANTYSGSTTVGQGTLLVTNRTGSATGTGPVSVRAGTLGGTGKILAAVSIGKNSSAATLAPGAPSRIGRLTLQNGLTFAARGKYKVDLSSSTVTADQVVAKGVRITTGATVTVTDQGNGALTAGTLFTLINNTATTPISGTFANLADGSTVVVGSNTYLVSYEGGTGNDLTLTVQ